MGAVAMALPSDLYGSSLALLTDLYQLTMAYGYWRTGRADREAVFGLSFRALPFGGGFAVACGLGCVADYLRAFRLDDSDLAYLAGLRGSDGQGLFEADFLEYLRSMRLSIGLDAVEEGTVVFPHEPLLQVRGPILQCQLLETPVLNLMNFQTLIATKSARVCLAAEGEPVLEFGLRRAQGIDGAVAASRAAYVGGCAATSNVLAGKLLGIPVKGTHGHSWVMSFDTELASFEAYARAMPANCIFLVDTYGTIDGVRNAVRVGKRLREQGHDILGIRLDSGDLADLARQAREILDAEGFRETRIVASGDLDEHAIRSLKARGAPICIWGVGTRLVTAHDEPALGGVFKLTAIRDASRPGRPEPPWEYKLKLSDEPGKATSPGVLQVRRFHDDEAFVADMIYDRPTGLPDGDYTIVDLHDAARRRTIPRETAWEDLLVPVFQDGKLRYEAPSLAHVRERTRRQLARLPEGVKRFTNPQPYPVGLEGALHDLKTRLARRAAKSPQDGLPPREEP